MNLEVMQSRFAEDCKEQGRRIEAERLTLQFAVRSDRKLDTGKAPITDSPLFGGPAQEDLFA